MSNIEYGTEHKHYLSRRLTMISMSIQQEPPEQTITLKERADYWVAIHEETGVGAQAPTREAALDELDEAVALHTNDATEPVEDE